MLPLVGKAGFALKLTEGLLLDVEGVLPRAADGYVAMGAEYSKIFISPWRAMARLEYNSSTSNQVSGVSGFSMGAALGYLGYTVDYAFAPYGSLGSTHQVSVSAKF